MSGLPSPALRRKDPDRPISFTIENTFMAVYDPDTPAYVIARYLGFICGDANPVAALRNPFGLENWTLPVLG